MKVLQQERFTVNSLLTWCVIAVTSCVTLNSSISTATFGVLSFINFLQEAPVNLMTWSLNLSHLNWGSLLIRLRRFTARIASYRNITPQANINHLQEFRLRPVRKESYKKTLFLYDHDDCTTTVLLVF